MKRKRFSTEQIVAVLKQAEVGVPVGMYNYDANDPLTADVYDADGNTTNSGGLGYVYDFENRLIQQGGLTIVYDGDGNRVSKTVAGVTTLYLVDSLNPTGYAQAVAEAASNGAAQEGYYYGLEQIGRVKVFGTAPTVFYVHDGHGSVRALTSTTGAVTDTYHYDAFGNLIHSTGTTPNNYLFAGEQFDPDLHLYYNRARYLNANTGRFWTMDTYEGDPQSPSSLHKYLYCSADPVDRNDSTGHDIGEILTVAYVAVTNFLASYPTVLTVLTYASAALTVGLLIGDAEFRAVFVASGGNPAALAAEFSTLLDEAGPTIAKEVVEEVAEAQELVGARFARVTTVQPGERFVRVAAKPEQLNFSFKSPGGVRAGTYAFPEEVFAKSAKTLARFRTTEIFPIFRFIIA